MNQEIKYTIVVVRKMNAGEFSKAYERVRKWACGHNVEIDGASFDEHGMSVSTFLLEEEAPAVLHKLRQLMQAHA